MLGRMFGLRVTGETEALEYWEPGLQFSVTSLALRGHLRGDDVTPISLWPGFFKRWWHMKSLHLLISTCHML